MLHFWICPSDEMVLKNTSHGLRLIMRTRELRRLTEEKCINQEADHFPVIFHIVALILLRIAIHPRLHDTHASG